MRKTYVHVVVLLLASAWAMGLLAATPGASPDTVVDAPAGFDSTTNGHIDQPTFNAFRLTFEERDSIADGLGPVYNAQSCAECHQNPVTGGISQVTELRAGTIVDGRFVDHRGGSLVNDRAIDAAIREYLVGSDTVTALRSSLNVLGDGFVEAIDDATLLAIARSQPIWMRGLAVMVPVMEAPGAQRVGRFGWKDQHASLLSFAGDAYLNEQGITNRLFTDENSSNGSSVGDYDGVADPEDTDNDIDQFAEFMRATKTPPRDRALAATVAGQAGAQLFAAIGCQICHVRDIVTAPSGTPINGGTLLVSAALGSKRIHPFSDFLLHDVGTGDGIVQNGGAASRNRLRTPPLWGSRTRSRLMHDGRSLSLEDAILRHTNQAEDVIQRFKRLSAGQRQALIVFLRSL